MPKISVIVPVYKAEKFLATCIESILNQTYGNLEIILVDDGSPDSCGKICEKYALSDSRVKVVHQKNAGVAAARNVGLDLAEGDYVTFVDSDDYIQPQIAHEPERLCDCLLPWKTHCDSGRTEGNPAAAESHWQQSQPAGGAGEHGESPVRKSGLRCAGVCQDQHGSAGVAGGRCSEIAIVHFVNYKKRHANARVHEKCHAVCVAGE